MSSIHELIEHLINVLEEQSKSFTENNLQKDCKSRIYDRLNTLENKIKKLEETLKGDDYSSGLINKIENINNSLNNINDYIKNQKAQLKTLNWLFGSIGFSNVICLLIYLARMH